MTDHLKYMSPAVRALNADKLEPKVAETLRERRPQKTEEFDLQDEMIEHLQTLGYLVLHIRPARVMRGGVETYETPVSADGRGYPDITAVHPQTKWVVIAELKSGSGRVRDDQLEWLRAWMGVPSATVLVIDPQNWEGIRALL